MASPLAEEMLKADEIEVKVKTLEQRIKETDAALDRRLQMTDARARKWMPPL